MRTKLQIYNKITSKVEAVRSVQFILSINRYINTYNRQCTYYENWISFRNAIKTSTVKIESILVICYLATFHGRNFILHEN